MGTAEQLEAAIKFEQELLSGVAWGKRKPTVLSNTQLMDSFQTCMFAHDWSVSTRVSPAFLRPTALVVVSSWGWREHRAATWEASHCALRPRTPRTPGRCTPSSVRLPLCC